MKPGDSETMTVDELRPLDKRVLSDPALSATHDDEFRAQQQKSERLNEYYDEVVVELRALLGQLHDEGS
jgi:hypothetical protein